MNLIVQPLKEIERTKIVSLEELNHNFLNSQDIQPSSLTTYKSNLKRFSEWLETSGRLDHLNQLTKQDILEYKRSLINRNLSSSTVSSYLVVVRRLFEWLESEKIYPNIAKSIKSPKKSIYHKKDTLTPLQIKQVLNSFDLSSAEGLRDYALVNLMVRTGLRCCEVATAKIENLRQEAGEYVLYIQGKGRSEADNFVLLTEETVRPLFDYLFYRAKHGDRGGQSPLFASLAFKNEGQALTTRSISRIVKNALRRVEIDSPRFTAHSLRHTAVTLAIKGGASLEQTQAMARHTDPRTTQVYFHNLQRINNAAEKFIKF